MASGDALQPTQFASLGHHDPNQGSLLPNEGGTEHRHLTQFNDLPEGAQQHTEAEMHRKYGLTMDEAVARYSHHIQSAFGRAQNQRQMEVTRRGHLMSEEERNAPVHAEGQDWYHGGHPASEAAEVRRMSQREGLPYHVIAGMKAAMSPNASPAEENRRVPKVAALIREGISSRRIKRGRFPTEGMHWSASNAASVAETVAKGGHMFEAPGVSSHGRRTTALHGPKPPGYGQSYTHARHEDVAPAIDRHMIRAAIEDPREPAYSPEDRKTSNRFQGSNAPLVHTVGVGQKGNKAVPGGKLMLAEAIRRASLQHGLTPAEGQTVIWHEKQMRDQEAENPAPQPESKQQSMLTAKNQPRKSAIRRPGR